MPARHGGGKGAPIAIEPDGLPGLLQRARSGLDAVAELEAAADRTHAAPWREDGPADLCEPPREEGRDGLDDVVVRLVPGDVERLRALAVLHRAEADQGLHLL